MRTRDLGIVIGRGRPGPGNAITDVSGVRVGHATIVEGHGPLVVGRGPVRTGVTMVVSGGADHWKQAVYAGCHRLNGNGEMTGLEWIREAGLLMTPIAITNTHSVGRVRDALVGVAVEHADSGRPHWTLPVVGETSDGLLNDMDGFHVRSEHARAALSAAVGGPVPEGNVGGGTGSVCHEFKGGIGTASRVIPDAAGGFTVGVLVQSNHGKRAWLRVDGVPVGSEIGLDEVTSPYGSESEAAPGMPPPGSGSIVVVVATDAPLLPHQCERVAQRAGLGVARAGGTGGQTSGDLFIAFATGNRLPVDDEDRPTVLVREVRTVGEGVIDAIFDATIEATEEAIINALVAAETMTGHDGITAHALPHDRLLEVMARYGRGAGAHS